MNTITQRTYSFNPLIPVFLNNLGLADKNNNGTIDRGADEGYEQFISKYGNADVGYVGEDEFRVGAADGRLDQTEITDHYYRAIRFVHLPETDIIERDLAAEIRRSGLPLVWLDDEAGTVYSAVTDALGRAGLSWPEEQVSEDEAMRLLRIVFRELGIKSRTESVYTTYYYTLPEMIQKKEAYCFEFSQFSFWFFSQLRIRSMAVGVAVTSSLLHQFLSVGESQRIFDATNVMSRYRIPTSRWQYQNPVEIFGEYYLGFSGLPQEKGAPSEADYMQLSLHYKQDSLRAMDQYIYFLLNPSDGGPPKYQEAIEQGELVLQRFDIARILRSASPAAVGVLRPHLASVLVSLLKSYGDLGDRENFERMAVLARRHFSNNAYVLSCLDHYAQYGFRTTP